MINWQVRIKNKLFWTSFIPACILVIQAVASLIGINLDLSVTQEKLLVAVDAIFGLLAVMGVVVDPTTEGIKDSRLARTYEKPKKDGRRRKDIEYDG